MSEEAKRALEPFPFFGGTELEVTHTHTASFWVECHDCGAKVDGEYFTGPAAKRKYILDPEAVQPNQFCAATVEELPKNYQQAYHSAVTKWNTRADLSTSTPDAIPLSKLREICEGLRKPEPNERLSGCDCGAAINDKAIGYAQGMNAALYEVLEKAEKEAG